MRVVLGDANSYLGKCLVPALNLADHQVVMLEQKAPNFAAVLEAEAVIIDLVRNSELAEGLLAYLKDKELESDLVLIGVSTVMTWSRSKSTDEKPLHEKSYKVRKTSVKYKNVKLLETMLLSGQRNRLSTFVVAPGVLYGMGEEELHTLLKHGWLCEQQFMPCIDDGNNAIPMIHVRDLARVLAHVLEKPPQSQYIVVTDTSRTTQKQLVEAINAGIGPEKPLQTIQKDHELALQDAFGCTEVLLADMRFDREAEDWYQNSFDMEWAAVAGITQAMALVREEFVTARGLRPVRVFITGPAASGKSFYAKRLAELCYLPHIRVADVIREVLERKDELAEEVKGSMVVEKVVKKKGAKPAKAVGAASGATKAAKQRVEVPRIPLYMLTRIMKLKLRSAPCRNKGFVLDGYPRSAEEARLLFGPDDLIEIEERRFLDAQAAAERKGGHAAAAAASMDDDGEEQKEAKRDESTMVQFAISLTCSKNRAHRRAMALADADVVAGHNDADGFERRWQRWEELSEVQAGAAGAAATNNDPLSALSDIEVLEVPEDTADQVDKGLSAMTTYVHRGGKPFNYHPTAEERERAENAERAERERTEQAAREERERLESKERVERVARGEQDALKEAQVAVDDRALVEACAQPLRKYLMSNVIPTLVDGMLDVCRVRPADPVDHLAEYLLVHAHAGAPSGSAPEN